MKKIISNILLLLLLLTFNNCSNDSEIINDNSNLSTKFSSYLLKYSDSNLLKNTTLYNQLDHSSNYENSIFNFITKDKSFDENNTTIYSSICGYDKHNQFDKDFIENVISDFKNLSANDFFSKMDYLESFVKTEVTNSFQKDYLLSSVEEFKWIKYSVNEMSRSTNDFDPCFDGCMEDTIEDNLGDANWIEWGQFLISAAETVAWWTASCTWDCI